MTTCGILLVDTSWANEETIEIEKATALRYGEQLVEGTKVLLYLREPVDAIVAEAELSSAVIEHETAAEGVSLQAPGTEMANTYHAPLRVTRMKGQVAPIPLNRLQSILGGEFSVYDEPWIPLDEAQYGQIVALWDKGQPE